MASLQQRIAEAQRTAHGNTGHSGEGAAAEGSAGPQSGPGSPPQQQQQQSGATDWGGGGQAPAGGQYGGVAGGAVPPAGQGQPTAGQMPFVPGGMGPVPPAGSPGADGMAGMQGGSGADQAYAMAQQGAMQGGMQMPQGQMMPQQMQQMSQMQQGSGTSPEGMQMMSGHYPMNHGDGSGGQQAGQTVPAMMYATGGYVIQQVPGMAGMQAMIMPAPMGHGGASNMPGVMAAVAGQHPGMHPGMPQGMQYIMVPQGMQGQMPQQGSASGQQGSGAGTGHMQGQMAGGMQMAMAGGAMHGGHGQGHGQAMAVMMPGGGMGGMQGQGMGVPAVGPGAGGGAGDGGTDSKGRVAALSRSSQPKQGANWHGSERRGGRPQQDYQQGMGSGPVGGGRSWEGDHAAAPSSNWTPQRPPMGYGVQGPPQPRLPSDVQGHGHGQHGADSAQAGVQKMRNPKNPWADVADGYDPELMAQWQIHAGKSSGKGSHDLPDRGSHKAPSMPPAHQGHNSLLNQPQPLVQQGKGKEGKGSRKGGGRQWEEATPARAPAQKWVEARPAEPPAKGKGKGAGRQDRWAPKEPAKASAPEPPPPAPAPAPKPLLQAAAEAAQPKERGSKKKFRRDREMDDWISARFAGVEPDAADHGEASESAHHHDEHTAEVELDLEGEDDKRGRGRGKGKGKGKAEDRRQKGKGRGRGGRGGSLWRPQG